MKIKTEEITCNLLKKHKVSLYLKRIDQLDDYISGNKYYKLKYNIIEAKEQGATALLTFGGAYSNHIVATSYAAKKNGFKSIGIIRGEKTFPLNPTLNLAKKNGMNLYYLSRKDYKLKANVNFLNKLKLKFSNFYLIPEGGTNTLAIKGSQEIINKNDNQNFLCCPVGTGGTITGIINAKHNNQKVLGFPAIKNFYLLQKDIEKWTKNKKWNLINHSYSGSYAKINKVLVDFINDFYIRYNIPLDGIYNGKMMIGIFDLIKRKYFPKGSRILAIHTGGLQANKGLNERFNVQLPIVCKK
tara:strand:+ start:146 stop:1042 length:897 start_codon:yes stop_codon:yes gene_type:complete